MQAETLTRAPAFHVFLFGAADAVTRWFWPPRRQRPFFLIGGLGFWLLVLTVLWAWYLLKAAAWSAALMALVLAQAVTLLAEAPRVIWRRAR